jgi:hypothetical protein
MNVKLGGMNSFLPPNQIQFISDEPTIVMGADVTHPSPGKLYIIFLHDFFHDFFHITRIA